MMKQGKVSWIGIGLVLFLAMGLVLVTTPDVQAGDATGLLRQADKEMRAATRAMFSGKKDQAVEMALKAKELIAQAEAADPSSSRLASAKKKLTKLIGDLERRTGRDLGGGSGTVRASTSTSLPPTPKAPPTRTTRPTRATSGSSGSAPAAKPAKLPYSARQALGSSEMRFQSMERNLVNIMDPKYPGDKKQKIANLQQRLQTIKDALSTARVEAKKKGVESHPRFDALAAQIAAFEKKFAETQAGHQQASVAAAANAGTVNADVDALRGLYKQASGVLDRYSGHAIHFNDMKPVTEMLAAITKFETEQQAAIQAKLVEFAKKYGDTADAIDKKAQAMGYSGQGRASYPYEQLSKGVANMAAARKAMGVALLKRANMSLDSVKGKGHDFYKLKILGQYQAWLMIAAKFDPQNAEVQQAVSQYDQTAAKVLEAFNAQVDSRKWPSHAGNAPSNVAELAKKAMAWFEAHKGWAKHPKDPRKPLAVVVTGPWSIQKKNLMGEPIMYGLPVLVAFVVDSEKGNNVARVYSLTLRTNEMRGVKPAPPYDHATVGNSYYIRPSAVK